MTKQKKQKMDDLKSWKYLVVFKLTETRNDESHDKHRHVTHEAYIVLMLAPKRFIYVIIIFWKCTQMYLGAYTKHFYIEVDVTD